MWSVLCDPLGTNVAVSSPGTERARWASEQSHTEDSLLAPQGGLARACRFHYRWKDRLSCVACTGTVPSSCD